MPGWMVNSSALVVLFKIKSEIMTIWFDHSMPSDENPSYPSSRSSLPSPEPGQSTLIAALGLFPSASGPSGYSLVIISKILA